MEGYVWWARGRKSRKKLLCILVTHVHVLLDEPHHLYLSSLTYEPLELAVQCKIYVGS